MTAGLLYRAFPDRGSGSSSCGVMRSFTNELLSDDRAAPQSRRSTISGSRKAIAAAARCRMGTASEGSSHQRLGQGWYVRLQTVCPRRTLVGFGREGKGQVSRPPLLVLTPQTDDLNWRHWVCCLAQYVAQIDNANRRALERVVITGTCETSSTPHSPLHARHAALRARFGIDSHRARSVSRELGSSCLHVQMYTGQGL